ncbi:hypothetical protein [Tardiphaga sp. 285_C5_N1_2]|uniref:hypothetical protein n=1 Tax=Tardiphaga sp. 285_C5_N1_2 TaxID=3240775 RepID=UPI003F8B1527
MPAFSVVSPAQAHDEPAAIVHATAKQAGDQPNLESPSTVHVAGLPDVAADHDIGIN